jgi:phage repressor protein C with HTH and peptisase S24 domain
MLALSHSAIWTTIDALAARFEMTPAALAHLAGLDPTSFNPSKRVSVAKRPRWPSTESLAKVLNATGTSLGDFAALVEATDKERRRTAPLIGLAQAEVAGCFDAAGLPTGGGWDQIDLPDWAAEGAYALEIAGDAFAPAYRDGDRILVSPSMPPRRADRVVVRTADGALAVRELVRLTANRVELKPIAADTPRQTLELKDVAWIARILWASQ